MAAKDLLLPKNYENKLDIISTEIAIKYVKDLFERRLAHHLNLMRISAPLYVRKSSGLNDDLNGVERPVSFDVKEIENEDIEIVHSLAKWKRMALKRYHMNIGKGIYTDMNAIRRDEVLDNLHSSYVDQWDWEKIIDDKNRTLEFLKLTVRNIMKALKETEKELDIVFENLEPFIQEDVYFITTQELEDRYPELTPKQREYEITKQYKTVFIMQIGDVLKSGERHDGRAPDYDDWSLNGDILLYYPILDCPIEISSMGIRVNKESLQSQLKKAGCEERLQLPFHQMLMKDELPLTIGGGIGQSRICLILLNKAHIGEVQVSQWDDEMIKVCQEHHITLL
ncbi:aspartate--ammonia ligase [[Eubacterium] hominis]|uniref:aspartate--ammonia ligase n=1 Tax=[Eubacterium] hominis TaxID=2764325 RepID=UPI003A4D7CA6